MNHWIRRISCLRWPLWSASSTTGYQELMKMWMWTPELQVRGLCGDRWYFGRRGDSSAGSGRDFGGI